MKAESERLVQALQRQLGADGTEVERIETPSAWVLLAGDSAWKIKKPVRLGFLDFGTLQRRLHFCEEELRLNRRHAPALYRGLVPITGTPQAPRLGGSGPAIEYALHLRRFPPRALLSEQLADGRLQPAHLDRLAQHLAALHALAEVAPPGSPWGGADELAGQARALLRRLAARGADVADLQAWLDAQLPRLQPLWQQRRQSGRVRECHGDLHLRNAVVLGEEVLAFDGLEFDPALRWIDVCADMAFMAMDLLAHARPALAWRFVNAWLDASGDHDGVPLLRFYLVERALVRALVGLLGAPAAAPGAGQYLALARSLALAPPRPRLLVTHGLSGSGKTWLTQALLEQAGALRLRSDVERKRLFGLGALEASAARVAGGIYGAQVHQRTYEQLALRAQVLLGAGWPVIVDAACLRRAERQRLGALAAAAGLPFTLLDCQADPATLRRRVQERSARGDDASEADAAVLARQIDLDEPLDAAERAQALVVRTDQPVDAAALAARWLGMGPPAA